MKPRVAFFGTGLMGLPMARRLAHAGYALAVWNRSLDKAQPLRALGVRVAETPTQAIAQGDWQADILICMLADGMVVRHCIDAVSKDVQPGMLVIDMSSTRQDEAQALHASLAERQVGFIDAPVSGGVLGAEAGTLAVMAGAEEQHYAAVEDVLAVFGRPTHVGAPGCGQLAKLCNQLIVGATINIVAEALLLAQAGGADPGAVRAALRGGFAESRILEVHGQRMLERNFLPGGQVQTQAKDMDNILAAAHVAGLSLPIARQVQAVYAELNKTCAQADHAAVLLALEQANPAWRLGAHANILP